jgi:hypothetical protein
MANTNVAFGLKPINAAGSAPATQGTNAYFIGSTADAIFQGSPVKADNGGSIVVGSATGDTEALVGVFAGCEYVSASTGKKTFSNYWPGSGSADTNFDIIGYVYDSPMQRFIVCTDASFTDEATARSQLSSRTHCSQLAQAAVQQLVFPVLQWISMVSHLLIHPHLSRLWVFRRMLITKISLLLVSR